MRRPGLAGSQRARRKRIVHRIDVIVAREAPRRRGTTQVMDENSSDVSPNDFEPAKPGTAARTLAQSGIEQLRAAGGVFVEAVRATRMPMVVTDPALPGNPIVFANGAFLELSGYSMAEVLGQQPYFMNGDETDPTDADRFQEALSQDRDEILEAVQYRKDGSRFVASVFLSAFKDGDGRTLHQFLSYFDITRRVEAEDELAARRKMEARLRESEERFRQFADATTDAFWVRNADSLLMEYLSPAFERIYGEDRAAVLGAGLGEWTHLIHPDDRAGAVAALERVRAGARVTHEFRIVRPDGALRWIENTDFPLYDARGRLQRIGGIARDVTAAKRAAARQQLLLAELQHRVRNILAMIRSVVRRTVGNAETVEEVANHLDGRLSSLARTQGLLTRAAGAGVDLEMLVREELLAQRADDTKVLVEGPAVELAPKAAEVLTLAVHELATNATKYGAFAQPNGSLVVRWRVEPAGAARTLRLTWRESGVLVVANAPRRRGFGSELVERRVPYELKGEGSMQLLPGGLQAQISFPLVPGESILATDLPKTSPNAEDLP
ncbi:MAG: PAS domain S-box protein [Phenylobacterium sp.]|uniref:PAS domain S-box protein n=1 Tax=Phenylobacterium sp. TaxID=1871053 RepID=UPI00391988C2